MDKGDQFMDKLYEILDDLREVEFMLENNEFVMESLETVYVAEHKKELHSHVHFFKTVNKMIREDLGETLSELDEFILDSK